MAKSRFAGFSASMACGAAVRTAVFRCSAGVSDLECCTANSAPRLHWGLSPPAVRCGPRKRAPNVQLACAHAAPSAPSPSGAGRPPGGARGTRKGTPPGSVNAQLLGWCCGSQAPAEFKGIAAACTTQLRVAQGAARGCSGVALARGRRGFLAASKAGAHRGTSPPMLHHDLARLSANRQRRRQK